MNFQENPQYDPTCEVPDFLLPNSTHPQFVVEVHQTDARDSFRMKTLRAFTAIAEAKAFYDDNLISVNILFGDPENELPDSNVRALFGFFDINLVPRNHASNPISVISLEAAALQLASDENWQTIDAVMHLESVETQGIDAIADLLKRTFSQPTINQFVQPLWQLERNRVATLSDPPAVGDKTYYKRNILRSLFFSDEHFHELVENPTPSSCTANCSEATKQQLILTKLAEGQPSLVGLRIHNINQEFHDFLADSDASYFRNLGKSRLSENPAMNFFFWDIRSADRRNQMANLFLTSLANNSLLTDMIENLKFDTYRGIEHRRAWYIDLCTRLLGISQNTLSRRLFTTYSNPAKYGDPISHLAPKTERFRLSSEDYIEIYASNIVDAFYKLRDELDLGIDNIQPDELGHKLLRLRLDGAIKLQKLNPLHLVFESLALRINLQFQSKGILSILSDLSGSSSAIAKYEMYQLTDHGKTALVNLVAVHDSNGDHKSKEWGARRLSTLYRAIEGHIHPSEYHDGIFVLDGEWEQKDVNRLYRSGWNYVVRLSELENTLREVFDLPSPALP